MNSPEEPRPRPSDEPETRPSAEPRAASEPPSLAEELPGGEEGLAEGGLAEGGLAEGGLAEGGPDGQAAAEPTDLLEPGPAPTFLFFGIVAAVSLIVDVASKAWAEVTMNARGFVPIELIPGHLNIILAYNRGGAWGLLQDASEVVRKPFFLIVSVVAVLFIVSLYGKLHHSQKALKWGLPLVLGGALGNLSDRITRSQVIDFIDYQGQWVLALNTFVRRYVSGWTVTDHWPTFNVADIAICVGVGLMAVDMFTSRRLRRAIEEQERRALEEQERREQGGTPVESRSA